MEYDYIAMLELLKWRRRPESVVVIALATARAYRDDVPDRAPLSTPRLIV
jgi:hypothetical protein